MSKAGSLQHNPNERRRIVQMADTLDAEEIALRTGYDEDEVQWALERAGVRREVQWWVRCNRTGRSFVARSKWGAYRLVCLRGLTDWDWGTGPAGPLLLAPPVGFAVTGQSEEGESA